MAIVSFPEALEIVRAHSTRLACLGTEQVELLASAGRVLGENIAADRDQPPFHRSTRDGFAVHAAEWSSGERLRLAGQLRAGELWQGESLLPATAIEIMTGAPVPAGADAVAMLEHADRTDSEVWASAGRQLRPGENIVPQASEARSGEVVLRTGTRLGAAEIAVGATCGQSRLSVRVRPSVAIVATGDELVGLEDTPEPHQIRNSNTYGIAALVSAAGGRPEPLEVAHDRRDDIRDRIAQGRRSDLLVLSGGVSAGKYDLVEEVLAEFGAEFLFTGVRMQPGKPVVFGRLPQVEHASGAVRECYFFGLPGNPVSTQVTFHCFVEPFLRAMGGEAWAGPRFAQGTLGEDVAGKAGLTRVLPARLVPGLDRSEVRLVGWQGSGDLAANARANCYAVLPAGGDLQIGDIITVLLR